MYVPNTDQKPPSDLSSPRQPMFHPEHRAKRAITVLLFLLGFPECHVPGRAEQKKKAGRERERQKGREMGICAGIVEEKEMAPHSSTLAWKIPRTEEPDRLQSIGSLRVGHS